MIHGLQLVVNTRLVTKKGTFSDEAFNWLILIEVNKADITGVAQTDNLENGYRYIFTETPLTDKFIKEWELEPLFETKGRINRFNELINENVSISFDFFSKKVKH
jgi:hypothetical protein